MFRTGWQMDYPSIENFLTPIYATGASSNDGDYSNPAFDKLLAEAAAADRPRGVRTRSTRRPRPCSPRTWRPSRCGTTPRHDGLVEQGHRCQADRLRHGST